MINEQIIKGNWTELRGRVKERWGDLTDDDLVMAEGRLDTLVGIIQTRTGEAREKIEHELDQMTHEYESNTEKLRRKASDGMEQATQTAREYADRTAEMARGQYDKAHEQYDELALQMRDKYREAETTIRRHPMESLCVAFGTGLLTGVVVGLMFRSSR